MSDVNDRCYAKLMAERDSYRQETSRLADELRKVRHELALEKYRRLSREMAQAYKRQDRAAWEKAAAERASLPVSHVEAAEMGAA